MWQLINGDFYAAPCWSAAGELSRRNCLNLDLLSSTKAYIG